METLPCDFPLIVDFFALKAKMVEREEALLRNSDHLE